jgi:hypothetical protein
MQVNPCLIHHTNRNVPQVQINNVQLPPEQDVKNLRLHLDRRLTGHKHIVAQQKKLGIAFSKMYCIYCILL